MENTSQFADITSEDNITYTNVDGNCVSDHFYDIFSFSNCLFCFYVVLAFSMSFGVGYFMVEKLRYVYRTINKLQLLALVPLVSPVIVFLVLHILSVYVKLVHVIIADSLSFGFLSGILVTLSTSPSGKYVMKLIVRRLPTKGEVSQQNDVWLESESIKVGELRSMIATAMGITPPERVLIESGKGRILDDINVDFFKIMRDSMFMMTDFFGYRTCSCYVTVISKDELPEDGTSTALVDGVPIHKKKSGTFLSMLNTKGEAKFGVELILYAKVAAAAANVIPFYVQPSETFASAATTNPKHTMRLIKWTGAASGDNLETNGSVNLISPSANGNAIVRPGTDTDTTGDGVNINLKASGKPIHNGDVVVIECEGK